MSIQQLRAGRTLSEEEIEALLPQYHIGTLILQYRPGGGTANANAFITTEDGHYLVKRRNPMYSAEAYVAFDHRLMEHLSLRGVPAPLAERTRAGSRWLVHNGSIYEMYRRVPGSPHDPGSIPQIRAAGKALAGFHKAVRDFSPPPGKEWPRYRDPEVVRVAVQRAWDRLRPLLSAEDASYLLEQVEMVCTCLPDQRYQALPKLVVHGDYHPANLLFLGDRLSGIFDLDWATVQPRILDLADGIVFFAGERSGPMLDNDITSLTQTWRPSAPRTGAFMEAYLEAEELSAEEVDALPLMVRALWLSCRVEGMEKVRHDRRPAYLLEGLLEPLRLLDRMDRLY